MAALTAPVGRWSMVAILLRVQLVVGVIGCLPGDVTDPERRAQLVVPSDTVRIAIGGRHELAVSVRIGGTTLSGPRLAYQTLDSLIAEVDSVGTVKALRRGVTGIRVTLLTAAAATLPETTVPIRVVIGGLVLPRTDSVLDALGDTLLVRPAFLDADGHRVDRSDSASFSESLNFAVLSDSGRGRAVRLRPVGILTAVANGTDTVGVSLDTVHADLVVTVRQRAVSMQVVPDSIHFDTLGQTRSLQAIARDRHDSVIATLAVQWLSLDSSIVRLSSAGSGKTLAAAYDSGTTRILAEVSDIAISIPAVVTVFPFELKARVVGGGKVTSTPGGIVAPGDSSHTYFNGTNVTLSARADSGWSFLNWGQDGQICSSATACIIPMTMPRVVTASFGFQLTVRVIGQGIVTSGPVGILAPEDSSATYLRGTNVVLTCRPRAGWALEGGCPAILVQKDTVVTVVFGLMPAIGVNPGLVTFTVSQGGANPGSQGVSVANVGGGALSGLTDSVAYQPGETKGWLSAVLSGTAAPTTLTLSVTTSGLAPSSYHATVLVGSSMAANSPQGVQVTLTVAVGGQPPAAPTSLRASVVSASRIALAWVDNAASEDGFRIERCAGVNCAGFSRIATVAANTTSFSDSGLSSGSAYVYRVLALNLVDSSSYSNSAGAWTIALLASGVGITELADTAGGERYFQITAPSGTTWLEISTVGVTGDADLYAQASALPTTSSNACRGETPTAAEICSVNDPSPQTWFILLRGYGAYSGIALTARAWQPAWTDDFESYTTGTWPSANWTNSGNNNGSVVDTVAAVGSKSFRLYGVVGSTWEAIGHRALAVTAPFVADCRVRNGSEPIPATGHQYRAAMRLNVGASWTTGSREFVDFKKDLHVYGPQSEDLGTYSLGGWYQVRVKYEYPVSGQVRVTVWMNNVRLVVSTFAPASYESSLSYLSVASAAGTSWFDLCRVSR